MDYLIIDNDDYVRVFENCIHVYYKYHLKIGKIKNMTSIENKKLLIRKQKRSAFTSFFTLYCPSHY